ncbi:hypothetical protein BDV96DRAFT_653933 [Lophiotrema nucula]|uniref:Uncharacterized protein n=1 Tax=Lophiotrema nucula TaxID=690887 RepID=A0A6A5YM93_9PLEO|nr:hypothetical protein BDV96DRAFT_653933 [Lophiotrema nucula]
MENTLTQHSKNNPERESMANHKGGNRIRWNTLNYSYPSRMNESRIVDAEPASLPSFPPMPGDLGTKVPVQSSTEVSLTASEASEVVCKQEPAQGCKTIRPSYPSAPAGAQKRQVHIPYITDPSLTADEAADAYLKSIGRPSLPKEPLSPIDPNVLKHLHPARRHRPSLKRAESYTAQRSDPKQVERQTPRTSSFRRSEFAALLRNKELLKDCYVPDYSQNDPDNWNNFQVGNLRRPYYRQRLSSTLVASKIAMLKKEQEKKARAKDKANAMANAERTT